MEYDHTQEFGSSLCIVGFSSRGQFQIKTDEQRTDIAVLIEDGAGIKAIRKNGDELFIIIDAGPTKVTATPILFITIPPGKKVSISKGVNNWLVIE